MDPSDAAKISASLNAEMTRRQAKRDAEEEARWREEYGDDPVIFFALWLERLANRMEKMPAKPDPPGYVETPPEEREVHDRKFAELMDDISRLIEDLERLARHEDDVAAGIIRRMGPVRSGIRAARLLERDPSAGR